MRFQKNYVYVDDDVFGFTIDATKVYGGSVPTIAVVNVL
jgi:hypothetical protein